MKKEEKLMFTGEKRSLFINILEMLENACSESNKIFDQISENGNKRYEFSVCEAIIRVCCNILKDSELTHAQKNELIARLENFMRLKNKNDEISTLIQDVQTETWIN